MLAPANRRAEVLDFGAAGVCAALILLVHSQNFQPFRLVLALLFTFFVPGRAIVSNWPRVARWSGAGMSIVFSLALLSLCATAALWIYFWRPLEIFQAESVLSFIGLGISIARRRRGGRALDEGGAEV